jgi:ATP-dependent DNA ligase
MARKDGDRVRLYSRPGNELTYRFALMVEARDGCTDADYEEVFCQMKFPAKRPKISDTS